eukprot:scaffold449_cov241-Pinguiococcus_pyrenoidosus.AAC.17
MSSFSSSSSNEHVTTKETGRRKARISTGPAMTAIPGPDLAVRARHSETRGAVLPLLRSIPRLSMQSEQWAQ